MHSLPSSPLFSFGLDGLIWGTDPLLMNAFNNVNLAASCVLTSTEYARHLGIPESKWIYPLGGAGSQDSDHCMYPCTSIRRTAHDYRHIVWERPNFYSSPAISRSLDACLEVSGLVKESIDVFDFYSYVDRLPVLMTLMHMTAASPSFPNWHASTLAFHKQSLQGLLRSWAA